MSKSLYYINTYYVEFTSHLINTYYNISIPELIKTNNYIKKKSDKFFEKENFFNKYEYKIYYKKENNYIEHKPVKIYNIFIADILDFIYLYQNRYRYNIVFNILQNIMYKEKYFLNFLNDETRKKIIFNIIKLTTKMNYYTEIEWFYLGYFFNIKKDRINKKESFAIELNYSVNTGRFSNFMIKSFNDSKTYQDLEEIKNISVASLFTKSQINFANDGIELRIENDSDKDESLIFLENNKLGIEKNHKYDLLTTYINSFFITFPNTTPFYKNNDHVIGTIDLKKFESNVGPHIYVTFNIS